MDIVRAFNVDDESHHILVKGSVEKPLFRAEDVGKALGIKDITSTIRNLDDRYKGMQKLQTLGGEQRVLFLTEPGLYRVMMRSNKKVCEHFQDWVFSVINEIRLKGTYELQKHLQREHESQLQLTLLESQQSHLQVTHRMLIDAYANQHVVYVARLLDAAPEDPLVKVGSTKDVKSRESNLRFEIGNFVYVAVVPCVDAYGLESYVHSRPQFASRRYTDVLANGKKSTEVAKLDAEWNLDEVVAMVTNNVAAFQKQTDRIKHEEWQRQDKLAAFYTSVRNDPELTTETKNMLLQRIVQPAVASVSVPKAPVDPPTCTDVHRHPQQQCIQQYDEDLHLVKSFDSITDAAAHVRGSRQSIIDASRLNMLYEGCRWLYVDASQKDVSQELGKTAGDMTPKQTMWRVAKLSVDETRVLHVYADKTKAARSINEAKGDVIERAMKGNTERGGFRWAMWDDLSEEVQGTYDKLVVAVTPNRACKVLCLHPHTGEQIGEPYNTVQEVYLKHKISPASLKKYSANGLVYKNYRWKILPNASSN